MPAPSPEILAARQYRFAACIRNPQQNPCPEDADAARMALYHELFMNNIFGVLEETLPITRRHLTEIQWQVLIRRFFGEHRCRTPYFYRLPGEFVAWLARSGCQEPEYIGELAEFEWTQRRLAFSAEFAPAPPHEPEGDLLQGVPLLNPTLQWRIYRYAVHRAATENAVTATPDPTLLLLWRDTAWQVRLLEPNGASARLIELIGPTENESGNALLHRIARELCDASAEEVINGGGALLHELRRKDVIIGSRRIGAMP